MFFKKKLTLDDEIERYGSSVYHAASDFCQALHDKHPSLPKATIHMLQTDMTGFHLILFRKQCIQRGISASIYSSVLDKLMTTTANLKFEVIKDSTQKQEVIKATTDSIDRRCTRR